MSDPFPRRSIDRWGFLFFPSEFPRWENDRARRLISVNAQFLWWRWRWRGEISSDGCKAWLQSGKFQSRFPSVTPELSDRPAGTVSYPGPVLELPASPARPGPGHFCQTVRTLTVLHTTTSHISSHSLQHSNTPTLHTETDQLLRGNLVDWEFTYPFTLTWYFWSLISGH